MSIRMNILPVFALFIVLSTYAQEENTYVREGNRLYKSKKYTEAEIAYRKGLLKNPKSTEAAYNLGNALYKQEKYAEALEQYQRVAPTEKISKEKLAAVLHNTGNALLMEKKVAESIDAYKKSLKVNPNDDETRYNLAFAQYLLKQQQQNKDNKQNQDKNKQQQDQQKQDNQEKKQEKKDNQQQEKPQPSDLSKEKAEQILQALMQDEENTMEKAKQQPVGSRKGTDKDW